MAEALSDQLTYNGTQERYHLIRRRQAEEVAKVIPTARPFPERKTGLYGWRLRPDPGTVDDHELAEL